MTGRGVWRRCTALNCVGVCHWDGQAWVCETCGTRWTPEQGRKWAPPDA